MERSLARTAVKHTGGRRNGNRLLGRPLGSSSRHGGRRRGLSLQDGARATTSLVATAPAAARAGHGLEFTDAFLRNDLELPQPLHGHPLGAHGAALAASRAAATAATAAT